jgi:hypothetical protein
MAPAAVGQWRARHADAANWTVMCTPVASGSEVLRPVIHARTPRNDGIRITPTFSFAPEPAEPTNPRDAAVRIARRVFGGAKGR